MTVYQKNTAHVKMACPQQVPFLGVVPLCGQRVKKARGSMPAAFGEYNDMERKKTETLGQNP